MKSTKNNTCKFCGSHIDKSDTSEYWVTIIKAKTMLYDGTIIDGSRFTICRGCSNKVKWPEYSKRY